ncbi:zinc ABC transporter substrate-binding protein [Paracoccus pacificus]|uniref:High-affinity zinc uptake system protein ZnuA n=1 Tax=Paracoccus pacificus TaxID=1463598 RepID=A0ABW4R9P1_9RHOB
MLRRLALLLFVQLCALPALAEAPKVVTDIPATESLVAQIMGETGSPSVLMGAGTDPHHYQLKPSQARALQDADLLIWIGPEMSPWLQRVAARMPKGHSMPLLAVQDTRRLPLAAGDDHGGDDHGGDSDGHEHVSDIDPHAWLDPENGKIWARAIADALAARDPGNAATYRANLDKVIASIAQAEAEAEVVQLLAPERNKNFIVFHDAYRYFITYFNIGPVEALTLSDGSPPSAARLSQLKTRIARAGAVCAFPEAQHDTRLLQAAIEGTGARLGEPLDPSGTTLKAGPDLYQRLILALAQSIANCLAG